MFPFRSSAVLAMAMAAALAAPLAQAQVTVTDAWIRGTVPQQTATGLFGRLTSSGDARLVAGSSPVASAVEIHEMRMVGDTMRMRAVDALPLPAGKAVELKPGGWHVMLLGLKQPLKAGDTVPVTLVVERADRTREQVELTVPVRSLRGVDSSAGHGGHGGHRH